MIWPYSKNCLYSVRSGYHWLRQTTDAQTATTSATRVQWSRLWKLNIAPKVKIFFWRLLHNALPYNLNLQRRVVSCHVKCIKCGDIEDIHHVFMGCEWATVFWFISFLGFKPTINDSSAFIHWIQTRLATKKEDVLALIVTTCWGIWSKRNDLQFSKRLSSPQEASTSVFQTFNDYGSLNTMTKLTSVPRSALSCKPPRVGNIKLNTDAGRQNPNSWRFGAVFRNHSGSIVLAESKLVRGHFCPEVEEALAVCWVLELAMEHRYIYVEVETDSLLLVQAFKSQSGLALLDLLATDILFLAESFEFFSVFR